MRSWKEKEHVTSVVHFRTLGPEELIQSAPELQQSEAIHFLKKVEDFAKSARLHKEWKTLLSGEPFQHIQCKQLALKTKEKKFVQRRSRRQHSLRTSGTAPVTQDIVMI